MNGIQIYATLLLAFQVIGVGFITEEEHTSKYWIQFAIAFTLNLPITGRIFGWW